jgi:guanylate kinase
LIEPMSAAPGRIVIVSGPSGAGKTTVVRRLFEICPAPLVPSVSATTRPPRPGERDGVDYHFLSPARFAELRAAGEFLECCEVHALGHWYGTLNSAVAPGLAEGKWVLLEIDVHGARSVVARRPDAVTIFVRPESFEELERRLRARGTESEAVIARRLETARRETDESGWYAHTVINRNVDHAAGEICEILARATRDPAAG